MGIHLDFLERRAQGTSIGIAYKGSRGYGVFVTAREVFYVLCTTKFTYRLRIDYRLVFWILSLVSI